MLLESILRIFSLFCFWVSGLVAQETIFYPNSQFKSFSYNSQIKNDQNGVVMTTQAGKDWPSFLIRGDSEINLYAYQTLNAVIKNLNDTSEEVLLSLKDHQQNTIYTSKTIGPGQTKTIQLKLFRKDDAWEGIKLFGMRTLPWMQGLDEPADLRRVKEMIVSLEKTAESKMFLIEKVFVEGKYRAQSFPEKYFPLVDRYGQLKHKNWDGKIKDDQGLKNALSKETFQKAEQSKYMGIKSGVKFEAKGVFYVKKHHQRWILVDPEGYPFYSMGVNAVVFSNATPYTDRKHWFEIGENQTFIQTSSIKPVYGYYKGKKVDEIDFLKWNLFRKYGSDYENKIVSQTLSRFRSWGVNTIGAWSDERLYGKKIPYTVILHPWSPTLNASQGHYGSLPDVFDDQFPQQIEASIKELRPELIKDEYCIGILIHNELPWGDATNIAYWVLGSYGYQPAKKVFVDELKTKYGTIEKLNQTWKSQLISWDKLLEGPFSPEYRFASKDLLDFSHKFAERYFSVCRNAVNKLAPGRLYLGCRFAQNNEVVSDAASKYCDVVSVNLYYPSNTIGEYHLPGKAKAEVPMMITEFHFGAKDRSYARGLRGAETLEERSKMVREYVKACIDHPGMVGTHWFQMYDQPVTGRVLDGENYQVGLLDITDTPYELMIKDLKDIEAYANKSYGGK